MATKTVKAKLRKAVLKKNKQYKFGKTLKAGESVFIKEEYAGHQRYVYTAFRKENDTVGFGLTRSEFDYTEKEKFVVSVTRISYSTRNIEVEADDRKQAKELAIDEAGGFDFSEQSADYDANSVLTEAEHKNLFK